MGVPFPAQPIAWHHTASFLANSTAGVSRIFGTNNYSKRTHTHTHTPTHPHRERTAFFLYVTTRPRLKVRLWRDHTIDWSGNGLIHLLNATLCGPELVLGIYLHMMDPMV